jgi:predicted dehydrogenase
MNIRTKIGFIGCRNISDTYFKVAPGLENLEAVACSDLDPDRARAQAAKHGLPRARRPEELLADPEVQIAVNLTPPGVHTGIARRAPEAGKSVYKGCHPSLSSACERPAPLPGGRLD